MIGGKKKIIIFIITGMAYIKEEEIRQKSIHMRVYLLEVKTHMKDMFRHQVIIIHYYLDLQIQDQQAVIKEVDFQMDMV